jgi:hypothetical protein
LSDENGSDDTSRPPEEEQVEQTRRVKPLFRFGRKKSKNDVKEGDQGPDTVEPGAEDPSQAPVRPVRVVKFNPFGSKGPDEETLEEQEAPGAAEEEAQFVVEEETPFAGAEETAFVIEEEAPFTEAEEAPFAIEEEVPSTEAEEAPFAVEEVPPFAVEEEAPVQVGEAPFAVEEETPIEVEEAPTTVEEETPIEVEEAPSSVEEETPFAIDEESPFAFEEEGAHIPEGDGTPSLPDEALDETLRLEPVHDSVSLQEEAETGGEFEFRSEESGATFETPVHKPQEPPVPQPPIDEAKPHYHKYLKPDEELLQRKQIKGPATGFDRDMDADAGEIDFGIDLIDPSDHKRKNKKPPRKDEGPGLKKGVGGHDFDGEVDTRGTGADIGIDNQRRRKRRL